MTDKLTRIRATARRYAPQLGGTFVRSRSKMRAFLEREAAIAAAGGEG